MTRFTALMLLLAASTTAAANPKEGSSSSSLPKPAPAASSVFSPTRSLSGMALGVPQAQNAPGFQTSKGPDPALPSLSGSTPSQGGAASGASAVSADENEVLGTYVGKVNGQHVYRASNGGYVFATTERPKTVLKDSGSIAATSSLQSSGAQAKNDAAAKKKK